MKKVFKKINWFFVGGDRWWNTPHPDAPINAKAGLGPGELSITQMASMIIGSIIAVVLLSIWLNGKIYG